MGLPVVPIGYHDARRMWIRDAPSYPLETIGNADDTDQEYGHEHLHDGLALGASLNHQRKNGVQHPVRSIQDDVRPNVAASRDCGSYNPG